MKFQIWVMSAACQVEVVGREQTIERSSDNTPSGIKQSSCVVSSRCYMCGSRAVRRSCSSCVVSSHNHTGYELPLSPPAYQQEVAGCVAPYHSVPGRLTSNGRLRETVSLRSGQVKKMNGSMGGPQSGSAGGSIQSDTSIKRP